MIFVMSYKVSILKPRLTPDIIVAGFHVTSWLEPGSATHRKGVTCYGT